jgi:enoyl-CoA hydratase/carnithine racemase
LKYEAIRLTRDAPLARIDLADAPDSNRIGARFLREIADAGEALRDESDVRAVLVAADGADFCAGWKDEVFAEGFDLVPDPFACLATLPQPVVCATQGVVSSAGMELALACDIRICSSEARFSMPETGLGMLPLAGGGQRLARLAGRGTALAMLLAGLELDAQGALRAGIVSKVVQTGRLIAEAETIAQSIAGRGPIATRYAKEAIHRGLDMTLEQALRYETDLTIILQTTEDRAEGVRAFLEKRRRPDFQGR